MRILFIILSLILSISVLAAGIPEKHQTDTFQIGVGSSGSQKNFVFDAGLGGSNPVLGVDTSLFGLNYSKNIFSLGDALSSQKSIVANIGNGSTNPKIIWSTSNTDWEFTNDGTNFQSFGSGSGGSTGVNLLTNPGFENGITQDWSNSGGTFLAVSSGANLLIGRGSATFQATASGQFVQSGLHTVQNGMQGGPCYVAMLFTGGDTNLTFQVIDSSNNVLNSQVIQPASQPIPIALPFQCVAGQQVRERIISTASSAIMAFDQNFLGETPLIQISQAHYIGGVIVASGCQFNNSAIGSFSDLAEMGSSCSSGNILLGSVSTFANTGNGSVTLNNLPPGEYTVNFIGSCARGNSSTNTIFFTVTDGSTNSPTFEIESGTSGSMGVPCTMSAHFSYQTTGTRTFKVQSYATGADSDQFGNILAGVPGEIFSIYRFPNQSESAVRPDTINWKVSGIFFGPNNFDLGTINQAYKDITNSTGVAFTADTGSLSVLPTCTGTNPPSDSTCSGGGSPDLGVSFNQPAPGDDEICVSFSHLANVSGAAILQDFFSLVETPINSQTILQQGTLATNDDESTTSGHNIKPMHHCEIVHFASAGQKAIRLFYQQSISGTITSSQIVVPFNSSTNSGPKFIIRPITQNIPAPLLTGSVISQSSGVLDTEFAYVRGSSSLTDCTVDPCTLASSSPGISVVNRSIIGTYVIHFPLGTYSAPPVCVSNAVHSGVSNTFMTILDGTECSTLQCTVHNVDTSAAAQDARFHVICTGPH